MNYRLLFLLSFTLVHIFFGSDRSEMSHHLSLPSAYELRKDTIQLTIEMKRNYLRRLIMFPSDQHDSALLNDPEALQRILGSDFSQHINFIRATRTE